MKLSMPIAAGILDFSFGSSCFRVNTVVNVRIPLWLTSTLLLYRYGNENWNVFQTEFAFSFRNACYENDSLGKFFNSFLNWGFLLTTNLKLSVTLVHNLRSFWLYLFKDFLFSHCMLVFFLFWIIRPRVFGAEPCLLAANWTGYYPPIWLVISVSLYLMWPNRINNKLTYYSGFYCPIEIEMSIAQGLVKRLEKEGFIRSTLKGKR